MRRLMLMVTAIMLVLGAFTASPRVSAAPAAPDRAGWSATYESR